VDPGAIDENGLLVAVEAMAAGLFELVPPASDEKA
jgi:hypothetical protein